MIALRRCLLVVAAVLVPLAGAAGAEERSFSKLYPPAEKFSAKRASAPSAFSPSMLLTPIYKLHEGTMKLHEGNKRMLYAGGKKLQQGTVKLHDNTKRFFVKTAGYLSPSNLMSSNPTPSRSGRTMWSSKSKKKSSNWLIPSWLKPEEPRNSKTMRDFLSQKRPEF